MSNPHLVLCGDVLIRCYATKDGIIERETLIKEVKATDLEVAKAIETLDELGLVRFWPKCLMLTGKGFKAAMALRG